VFSTWCTHGSTDFVNVPSVGVSLGQRTGKKEHDSEVQYPLFEPVRVGVC